MAVFDPLENTIEPITDINRNYAMGGEWTERSRCMNR